MTFPVTPKVKVTKDDGGVVRTIHHPRQPYQRVVAEARELNHDTDEAQSENDALRQLAHEYMRQVMPVYGMDHTVADDLEGVIGVTSADEGSKLRFENLDKVGNQAVVSYSQTELSLPVWRTGMSVKLLRHPNRVIGSRSSVHTGIDVQPPRSDSPFLPALINPETLAQVLHLGVNETPTINSTHLLIYQLDRNFRGTGAGRRDQDDETQMHIAGPTLQLPELPSNMIAQRYYVVTEALFTLKLPDGDMNWRALIEPETGAVLRLDAFVGCVDGYVFLTDPITKTGNPDIRPDAATDILNHQRDWVPLKGLISSSPQGLRGHYVHVRNLSPPDVLPPTEPKDSHFLYSVPTDDFSAVNAYFHCDRLFRLLEEMRINVEEYFGGTTFPVPVDHRAMFGDPPTANSVNARALGDADGDGSGGFLFALVQKDTNVGMAVEWRVVLHEFGHAILWDHIDFPNFLFVHSPGDALAAILVDPDSNAPDRYRTFPWSPIQRRHDRRVEDGWGWGGSFDDRVPVGMPGGGDRAGYNREQILSTTLFRYYRAIGGDHSDKTVRSQASRYAVYVIFQAVGVLSKRTAPVDAEDFANELMQAEESIDEFEGYPGRTTHKVIRWAFARQGLYRRRYPRRPVVRPGPPPKVDVYIDDGRDGGYDPRPSFVFSSTDIWNRNQADDGDEHQQPVAGQSNYLYVRVRNRGTKQAENAIVKTFMTPDGGDRIWPTSWTALDPASLPAKGPIESKGERVVGPFSWTHSTTGSVAVLASISADEDESNMDSVPSPTPVVRLTHCDNNIAGRILNVRSEATPVAASDVRVAVRPMLTIPDADPNGVMSELSVPSSGTIAQVNVSISILHSYIGDLLMKLQSPSGTDIVLFEGEGIDSTDNLIAILTSDAVEALNEFKGEDCQGAWKLRVVDRSGLDEGTLVKWGLLIKISQ